MAEKLGESAGIANTRDWLEATKDMEIKAYWAPLIRDESNAFNREFNLEYPPIDLGVSVTPSRTWNEEVAKVLRDRSDAWQRLAKL